MNLVVDMLKKIMFLTLFSVMASYSLACSSVFITSNTSNHDAVVGRTMDFPQDLKSEFAFGAVGIENESNVNLTLAPKVIAADWQTQYPFIGINVGYGLHNLMEGMNNQGLYAGYLYLSGITKYPKYRAYIKKPVLGALDIANFVLGTASNVPMALDKIKKYQIVQNAFADKDTILSFPLHLTLHDKLGNSAVIEWVGGKTDIYFHQAGTHFVQETINNLWIRNFDNFDASIVTNAPKYSWQINNAKRYDTVFNGNTNKQYDGLYMNGSGMEKLPGDFTPPGRLARGYQLAKLMPLPTNTQQTLFETKQVLNSMTIPIDANPSPTVWSTISDLGNNVYYYKPVLKFISHSSKKSVVQVIDTMTNRWQAHDLNTMNPSVVPQEMLSAQIMPGNKATRLSILIQNWLLKMVEITHQNIKLQVNFTI